MQRFQMSHGSGGNWHGLAEDCIAGLGTIPSQTNLGFIYATTPLAPHLGAILTRLRAATGIEHWVGGLGMGINCTAQEYYDTPALAVLVGVFPDDGFCIIPGQRGSLDSLRSRCGLWYRRHRHHLGLLHGDPRNPAIPELLRRLSREIPGAQLLGGLTSSTGDRFPQIADHLTEGGISGVLFAPSVPITHGLTQGCSPLGPVHRITECETNAIHGIDDRPALDVLYEDIGEILARDPRRIAGYIFAGLPVGQDDDDYLVRNLLGLDLSQRRVFIGEPVTPGQPILFCRRDGNSARDDLLRMLRELRRRLPGPAKGGIYVSCLGRGRHLFGEDSRELRLIRDELGNVPLVGFFANGEFCGNRLYGYTGVLTLFS